MASSKEHTGEGVLGAGVRPSLSTKQNACGSGSKSASMIFALDDENCDSTPIVASPPSAHARRAAIRGRIKALMVDAHMQRSAQPEPRMSPCQANAPMQRSVKPTPRVRHRESSSSRSVEAVAGGTTSLVHDDSLEEVGDEANVIGRQHDVDKESFDHDFVNSASASRLVSVATLNPFDPSNGVTATSYLPSSNHFPSSNVITEFAVVSDVHLNRENPSGNVLRDNSHTFCSHALNNRLNGNEQSSFMTAGTMHYPTLLSIPDFGDITDTSSDEEFPA
eukprot:TRINITY_DN21018_c0_g1_i1.p1 TRINITY_DN21018_c0_g1~~TRINITY_DN21018_c0_g1_i1.p1  ORF type:complete len:278 (-),score=39.60 TRINITY_DN21018_c0_g1_i1:273-1106(-)